MIIILNLTFGFTEATEIKPSAVFNVVFDTRWMEDDLVKRMILDIDKSTVVEGRVIDSPILGPISPLELSGGVKTVILTLFKPEYEYNGSACGDNCAKWILEVAKRHDIRLAYEHLMSFPEPFEIRVVNSGKIVHTMLELLDEKMEAQRGYMYYLDEPREYSL